MGEVVDIKYYVDSIIADGIVHSPFVTTRSTSLSGSFHPVTQNGNVEEHNVRIHTVHTNKYTYMHAYAEAYKQTRARNHMRSRPCPSIVCLRNGHILI